MARFNGAGVMDVLEADSRKSLQDLQAEDMVKLGCVILSLASRTTTGPKNAEAALQLLTRHFSADLQHVVATLCIGKTTAQQVSRMIADRIHDELDQSVAATDALHSHLRNEYENGRIMRLLFKLNFMNERPETSHSPQWSETGDRYVLKLFRDYVFHQNQGEGAPVLDAGHVVSALNKLDCGDPEKILLCSRDNKDLLVVSFADVRRCLETAFEELTMQCERANQARRGPGGR
jgi:PAB-dependent poly(A)-specific ribonuclease subunit 3